MAIRLKKVININGNYTDKEKEILENLIISFRISMADDEPSKNILDNKKEIFTDNKIIRLFERAAKDINSGSPRTKYSLFEIANKDDALLIDGAMVFALIAEGLLQVRNQIDFSDSGLSIAMFNKTQVYQGWASFLLQTYIQNKADFKSSLIVNDGNIFHGIHSEFSYWSGEDIW